MYASQALYQAVQMDHGKPNPLGLGDSPLLHLAWQSREEISEKLIIGSSISEKNTSLATRPLL